MLGPHSTTLASRNLVADLRACRRPFARWSPANYEPVSLVTCRDRSKLSATSFRPKEVASSSETRTNLWTWCVLPGSRLDIVVDCGLYAAYSQPIVVTVRSSRATGYHVTGTGSGVADDVTSGESLTWYVLSVNADTWCNDSSWEPHVNTLVYCMARVVGGSHSFTCTSSVYLRTDRIKHTRIICISFPSQSWSSFTDSEDGKLQLLHPSNHPLNWSLRRRWSAFDYKAMLFV